MAAQVGATDATGIVEHAGEIHACTGNPGQRASVDGAFEFPAVIAAVDPLVLCKILEFHSPAPGREGEKEGADKIHKIHQIEIIGVAMYGQWPPGR